MMATDKYPEIIVGTNEEFIISYKLMPNDGRIDMKASFTNHSHMGSVRQVAVSGKYLVSGGTDELIRIFNLNRRREEGVIMEHEGTVRCLQFHGTTHLFSASEDNKICIFKKGNWKCEKTLKGHLSPVMGIAIHPSGKLALSVCKEKKLITWNLIKGRRAFITNIKQIADSVHWSLDGSYYLVVVDNKIDIYETATASITHTADFKERVNAVLCMTNDIVIIGGEGRNICLYDLVQQKELFQWEAHTTRIKCLSSLKSEEESSFLIASASSDGFIKIWKLQKENLSSKPALLGEVNTSCRIICMAVHYPSAPSQKSSDEGMEVMVDESQECDADSENSSDEDVEIIKPKAAPMKKRVKIPVNNRKKKIRKLK